MFAYCNNNPVACSDSTGNNPFDILHIFDYFLIHFTVQLMIRDQNHWEMEVEVYDSKGQRGRLDLYDSLTNQFYEVKSDRVAFTDSTSAQMLRYKDSVKIKNHPYRSHPAPGTETITGGFNFGAYYIEYHTVDITPGLIIYSKNKRVLQEQEQEQEAFAPVYYSQTAPSTSSSYSGIPIVILPMGGAFWGGYAGAYGGGFSGFGSCPMGGQFPWSIQPA